MIGTDPNMSGTYVAHDMMIVCECLGAPYRRLAGLAGLVVWLVGWLAGLAGLSGWLVLPSQAGCPAEFLVFSRA